MSEQQFSSGSQYFKKVKLIFVPFVIIDIVFIGAYTFLHWLLFYKYQVLSLDEMIVKFWLPYVLPWLPILLWLRPRIKTIDYKDNDKGPFAIQLVMSFAIAVPALIAQEYMITATGKLTQLQNISQYSRLEKTAYYQIKDYTINKRNIGVTNTFHVRGKNNTDFDMDVYVVCPIQQKQEKPDVKSRIKALIVVNGNPEPGVNVEDISSDDIADITVLKDSAAVQLYGESAKYGAILINTKKPISFSNLPDTIIGWLGVNFSKTISNRLSVEEKVGAYSKFIEACEKEFDTMNVQDFVYLKRIHNTEAYEAYCEAIDHFATTNQRKPVLEKNVFIASHEPFEERNGKKLIWTGIAWAGGLLLCLGMLLVGNLNLVRYENYVLGKKNDEESGLGDYTAVFRPRAGYFITPILIAVNVLVFLVMAFVSRDIISFDAKFVLDWGANARPVTTNGQWWRLLTNTFLHGGIIHLLANMYGLFFVGIFLEPVLGRFKYGVLYLVCGVLASIASIYWYENTISVGASGAIFGLYGIFLAFMLTKIFHPEFSKAFLLSTVIFIAYNLLAGLAGGIDNAAHIGGLISGFLIGLILSLTMEKEELINEVTEDDFEE